MIVTTAFPVPFMETRPLLLTVTTDLFDDTYVNLPLPVVFAPSDLALSPYVFTVVPNAVIIVCFFFTTGCGFTLSVIAKIHVVTPP